MDSYYRLPFSLRKQSLALAIALIVIAVKGYAQTEDVKKLKALSIEQLMNIEVTTVSRGPLQMSHAASAVQVITTDDIRRSGATSIPEALRLAPNLQVAQLNSSAWIISARGFNTVFANKLLVLIDGRTVYTPLFGGVLWDLQNVLLEDVERIEVISGPGGTLWGANAVNGVINIITKNAKQAQGLYVTAAGGDYLKRHVAARYGTKLNDKTFFKFYGQHAARASTFINENTENPDEWENTQAGFSLSFEPNQKDKVILQGDIYKGLNDVKPTPLRFDGQNALARWTRKNSERSDFAVQLYYDRYWRDDKTTLADELTTYDVDFQYRFSLGKRHNVLAGAGYRLVDDLIYTRVPLAGLVPEDRQMPLLSGFIQDEITLADALKLTIGSKFLDNIFSGFEYQPSARIAWTLQDQTLWAAASRAVRAPSRFDVDYRLPIEPQPPTIPSVAGGPDFDSEKLHAFELGYKATPTQSLSISIATFYNDYKDVYSVEALPGTFTYTIQNGSKAENWGAELSGVFQLAEVWRLRGGFTYLGKDLRPKPGREHNPSYLSNDSKHRFLLQSMIDLPGNFTFDLVARYADNIVSSFATASVPAYVAFDSRIAWEYNGLELSVVGQNLNHSFHQEFGALQIPRSVYGRITFRLKA